MAAFSLNSWKDTFLSKRSDLKARMKPIDSFSPTYDVGFEVAVLCCLLLWVCLGLEPDFTGVGNVSGTGAVPWFWLLIFVS